MNAANLQLEGLLLALYALLDAVKSKGLLTEQEIDEALATAEANALADPQRVEQLSPASLDGVTFPIRFLRVANTASKVPETFTTLTQLVGETKPER
jgi:hypothetical protein